MMEIWEGRYYSEKYDHLESPETFETFQTFLLELNKPRKLTDLTTYVLYGEKRTKPEHKTEEWRREYKKMQDLSHKYSWFDRAAAYDNSISASLEGSEYEHGIYSA